MLAGGITVFSGLMGFDTHKGRPKVTANKGYIKLRLNDLEIYIVSDGRIRLDNPQPVFAPAIDPADVKNMLNEIYLDDDGLDCAINVMLIKKDNRIILIDTGSGYHFGESSGWLLDNLEAVGIKAAQVTDVFITHAHIDHIGGIVSKSGNLIYPNARHYIAEKEYNFWMSGHPDFSKSKNTENPKDSVDLAQVVLSTIKEKLELFHAGDVLFSCIRTVLAAGHTPGHTVFTVFSGDKSIKHIVDTIHTPLLIARPEWGTQWDVDFEKGVDTRKRILEDSYTNRVLVMTSHLPWPGLGHIGKNESAYEWLPFPYFTPNEIIL